MLCIGIMALLKFSTKSRLPNIGCWVKWRVIVLVVVMCTTEKDRSTDL